MLYLFSGNVRHAKRLAREIPSGGAMINETILQFINMSSAFGGVGESGMGNYHGKAGFKAFSQQKTIMHKPNWFELFLKYPPHKDYHLKIFRSVLGRSFRNLWN
jgi:aldehyde dehydrogenase (NAD+)